MEYEKNQKLIRKCGMKYYDANKKHVFYEFHVDNGDVFMGKVKKERKYGGYLSVLF